MSLQLETFFHAFQQGIDLLGHFFGWLRFAVAHLNSNLEENREFCLGLDGKQVGNDVGEILNLRRVQFRWCQKDAAWSEFGDWLTAATSLEFARQCLPDLPGKRLSLPLIIRGGVLDEARRVRIRI